MLLQCVEKRKGRGRRFVKMDQKRAEDDAGGVGHGRTSGVGIDICKYIRIPLASGNGKVGQTCSAVIESFDPSKTLGDQRSARPREVVVYSGKTNRPGRQEDWKWTMLPELGKLLLAAASGIGHRSRMWRPASTSARKGPTLAGRPFQWLHKSQKATMSE